MAKKITLTLNSDSSVEVKFAFFWHGSIEVSAEHFALVAHSPTACKALKEIANALPEEFILLYDFADDEAIVTLDLDSVNVKIV